LLSGVAAVSAVVPALLSQLSSTQDPATAQRIVQLLVSLAQKPRGARALVGHSLMLYLCNHPILRPKASSHMHAERQQQQQQRGGTASGAGGAGASSQYFARGGGGGGGLSAAALASDRYYSVSGPGKRLAASHSASSGMGMGFSGLRGDRERHGGSASADAFGGVSDVTSSAAFGAVHHGSGGWAVGSAEDLCVPYVFLAAGAAGTTVAAAAAGSSASARSVLQDEASQRKTGVRSGWHRVWCSVVSLVANLLRALPKNEQFLDEVRSAFACSWSVLLGRPWAFSVFWFPGSGVHDCVPSASGRRAVIGRRRCRRYQLRLFTPAGVQ
jgi:hypothetical protein